MIETHIHPDSALSDKMQQVTPQQLEALLQQLQPRHTRFDEGPALETIRNYRAEIDQLDNTLLQLLRERMKYSTLIGELKKENNISIFQPSAGAILENDDQGEELQINPGFIRNLFIQIHDESVRFKGRL
jgi:chorismate mutase